MAGEKTLSGKYMAYPEYKNSGIECLGMLPSHWVVQSLSIATKRISVGLATSVTGYYRDKGVPIIRNMNIKEGYFDGSDMLYLDEKFAAANSGKVVYKGDVIAVHTGSNLGLACIVPEEFDDCHTFTTLIVTTSEGLLNKYLTYCINSAYGKAEVHRLKFGFGKDNLNVKEFKCFYTLLPEYSEQEKIAYFLDHETDKINTLIEKQQQLIKLLKEKRQAVISHAVTKGLNPRGPMRDSGTEWLGEVPEGWVVSKIKYVAELTPKKSHVENARTNKCSFIPMEKLKTDILVLDEVRIVGEVIDGYTYFENEDVLMAKVTPCFENKNMVVARGLENGIGFGSSEIYVLRANSKILNDYLYYRLQEDIFMEIATASMSGAGGLKRVPSDIINNFIFALPPKKEQAAIYQYIRSYTSKCDDLINKAEYAVTLMQERRTALISAAVTGKIDVRSWQAPKSSAQGTIND
jgi:type I restriction enzyme S subunit